ncbi:MAG: IS66 family insertion sequence element accessory protein TnpB [Lachnospiraceae bacterium]
MDYIYLRYGINSLASIIERKYHTELFIPNTLFLFCGRSASKIKGLLWEGDGFLLLYTRVECGHSS